MTFGGLSALQLLTAGLALPQLPRTPRHGAGSVSALIPEPPKTPHRIDIASRAETMAMQKARAKRERKAARKR